tara:strand:- start:5079 stop:5393 length:315 start_codon:yes stop_codon:yes gene_type:complete
MSTRFSRVFSTTPDLSIAEDNTQAISDLVEGCLLIEGVFLKDVSIKSSQDNFIGHSLGKDYTGYIVVERDKVSVIHTSPTVNNKKSSQLILKASVTAVVSLWVF